MNRKTSLWAGIGLTAVVTTTAFLIKKRKSSGNRPPKDAPQLEVQNPGDQSEFLTTAQETEYERREIDPRRGADPAVSTMGRRSGRDRKSPPLKGR